MFVLMWVSDWGLNNSRNCFAHITEFYVLKSYEISSLHYLIMLFVDI